MPDGLSERSQTAAVPETGTSRALAPMMPMAAPGPPRHPSFRPDARFVAHLIATVTCAPQTRTLRRAAAENVASTYSSTSTRVDPVNAVNGLTLSLVA